MVSSNPTVATTTQQLYFGVRYYAAILVELPPFVSISRRGRANNSKITTEHQSANREDTSTPNPTAVDPDHSRANPESPLIDLADTVLQGFSSAIINPQM